MSAFDSYAFTSLRIIEDANALEETNERTFPASRHRSARIHKKLVKRHGGEFVKVPAAFSVAGVAMIVHPAIAARIRAEIKTRMEIEERRALFGDPFVDRALGR